MVDHLIEVDLEKTRSNLSEQKTEINDDFYPEDELEKSGERIKEANSPTRNRKKKCLLISIVIVVIVAIVLSISIPVARKRNKRNDAPSEASKSPIENCDNDNDNVFRSKLPTYLHISIGGISEGLSPAQDNYIEDTLQSTYNSLAGCNDQFKRRMEGITRINKTNIDGEDGDTIVQATYRSTVSYDCDEEICPDPEAPAFSSGPSTPPSGRKLRDRIRGRKRILKPDSNKKSKKKVISALDYFEQINESLQKMPKADKNQNPYILDASTGAGVPKSQYKSKEKEGSESTSKDKSTIGSETTDKKATGNKGGSKNTATDDTALDATPTDKDSVPKKKGNDAALDETSTDKDSVPKKKDDKPPKAGNTGPLDDGLDQSNGWQDDYSNTGTNNAGGISSNTGISSGNTGTLFDPIITNGGSNGNPSNNGGQVSSDLNDNSSTRSTGDSKKSKGKKSKGKKSKYAANRDASTQTSSSSSSSSGPPGPIVPDTVVTSGPTPGPVILDTVITSGPTPGPIIPDTGVISDPIRIIPDAVTNYTIQESVAVGCECASDIEGSSSSNPFCSVNRDYYDSGKINCLHDFYPLGQGDMEFGFCDEVRPFCCLDEKALTDPSGGSIYASCREVACGTIAELDGFIDFSSLVEQSCAPISLQAWINEINYTPGTETEDNFVEIAFHNSLDIDSFDVYLYNGANGKTYNILEGRYIAPTAMQEDNGIVFAAFHISIEDGLHANGDGMALYYSHPNNAGEVLQFISYGGTFLSADGAAETLQSSDIGVIDSSSHQLSVSVQGEGCHANDYQWGPTTLVSTPGEKNKNQILNCS